MRMRVGYGPWGPEWTTHLVSPSPWWFAPLVTRLELWATRFEGWPAVHDRIWAARGLVWDRAVRWRERRGCSALWWEYRAS